MVSLDKFLFIGVIFHEFAHKKFAQVLGLRVTEVRYFNYKNSRNLGYVKHEATDSYTKKILVSTSPFIINTFLGVLFVNIAHKYTSNLLVLCFAYYLSFSLFYHSFPSTADIKSTKPKSKIGYLNPFFIIYLPLVIFLIIFTRYIHTRDFSITYSIIFCILSSPQVHSKIIPTLISFLNDLVENLDIVERLFMIYL